MTKVDTRTPEEPTIFQYDARDRLVQVTQDQLGVEAILGQYDYNHEGDRIRHRHSDRGDVDYYYDDGAVLEERNAADDSLLAYYQYADRLLALVQPQGTQYYHHDALGSTVGLTDQNGNSKKSYHLDPWGNIRWESGTSDNRHIFTGHEHDTNTGLVYFGARYYDPEIGRFITQDTYLGEENTPPSLHRYLYAYSNPTVFVDLEGYQAAEAAAITHYPVGMSQNVTTPDTYEMRSQGRHIVGTTVQTHLMKYNVEVIYPDLTQESFDSSRDKSFQDKFGAIVEGIIGFVTFSPAAELEQEVAAINLMEAYKSLPEEVVVERSTTVLHEEKFIHKSLLEPEFEGTEVVRWRYKVQESIDAYQFDKKGKYKKFEPGYFDKALKPSYPGLILATVVAPASRGYQVGSTTSRTTAVRQRVVANAEVEAHMYGELAGMEAGAVPISRATRGARTTVQANKCAGDAFRDQIAEGLRAEGLQVQTEVTKKTIFGRRVIDIEVSKGGKVLGGVETKVGKSPYKPSQRAKDKYLELTEGYKINVVRDK